MSDAKLVTETKALETWVRGGCTCCEVDECASQTALLSHNESRT